MDHQDILQEVTEEEVPKVLEILKQDWPKHFLLHQFITIMQEYKNAKIQTPKQVLYRHGNLQEGVYFLQTSFLLDPAPIIYIFIYTVSTNLSELLVALTATSRVPWFSEWFMFELTMSRFSPVVQQAASLKGVDLRCDATQLMYLPAQWALSPRPLPDDVYLDYLDDSHVAEVDANWPFRFDGSYHFLAAEIRNNFGLGLFKKSDKKLLSSSLSFHSGGIFVLYTDPEFRGRGYAEIIVCNMVKEIRQRGRIPFCTVMVRNTASLKLFKKLGFQEDSVAEFIHPAH